LSSAEVLELVSLVGTLINGNPMVERLVAGARPPPPRSMCSVQQTSQTPAADGEPGDYLQLLEKLRPKIQPTWPACLY